VTTKIRVLVVEPSPLLGLRLGPLFGKKLERVGGPVTAAGLLSSVRDHEPQVVLVRVDGPSSELTRAIELTMAEYPVAMLLVAAGGGPRQAAMALLAAGALDVWATPTHMKKGRPGLVVGVLAPAGLRGALEQVLFRHSTTLGVRAHAVTRTRLARRERVVATAYGPIRVKVAERPDAPPLQQPEHEDVAAAARAHGTSERVVWEAALAAAWATEG